MLRYQKYEKEEQLPEMIELIEKDLSEPYSVYTYRYFLLNFPDLSYLVFDNDRCVGVIISKIDEHRNKKRGYIGMLAVDSEYRGLGIGSQLVKLSLEAMIKATATEVCCNSELSI
jgi:peptide alpha-N-acetyltransferase